MRDFALLFESLDGTTGTNAKVEAIAAYLSSASAEDAAWAVFFLTGRRLPSPVRRSVLREAAREAAAIPDWLFEECYSAVADLAETIARIVPEGGAKGDSAGLAEVVETRVRPLAGLEPDAQKAALRGFWARLRGTERIVFTKLLTGSFRVGVSLKTVVKALAKAFGVPRPVLSHRLMGRWEPTAAWFRGLVGPEQGDVDVTRPYPFALAYALDDEPASLGDPAEWLAEPKWDGVRCQAVRRAGEVALWSRGEGLVQGTFPELADAVASWPPGTVVDAEALAWRPGDERPLPFSELQRRLNRKSPGKGLLAEVPCRLVAFDLLEEGGRDIRDRPLEGRRRRLEGFIAGAGDPRVGLSPAARLSSWDEATRLRSDAPRQGAEGIMLKRLDSAYEGGRRRGAWWKWKVASLTLDAVLVTAQRGSGRRASLYTDYTFALWHEGSLVPFAKAYSGLTDAEIAEVDAFVRRHTREKFGPVRSVEPRLVFEIAFEGIHPSRRHRSGLAVRFPRIARWRRDKGPEDADRLETARALLPD